MEQLQLFSGTLGLTPPWQVTSVVFDHELNRMDIRVEPVPSGAPTCPSCGSAEAAYAGIEHEVWFHDDFLGYHAYLHARFARLSCCGAPLPRPWCRPGSRFTLVPPGAEAASRAPTTSGEPGSPACQEEPQPAALPALANWP